MRRCGNRRAGCVRKIRRPSNRPRASQLGMIKPGEVLFIVKDVDAPPARYAVSLTGAHVIFVIRQTLKPAIQLGR